MDPTKYKKIFTQESNKYLDELDGLLLQVEKDLSGTKLWEEIHGKIHSIKGMARALSLEKITGLSHAMEDWCEQFQQGALTATPKSVQLFFDGSDLLRFLVTRMGETDSFENQSWYSSLMSRFEQKPNMESAGIEYEPSSPPAGVATTGRIDQVRVRYSLIEELLGLSQEILLLEKTLPQLPDEVVSSGLKNWIDHYASLLKSLYFRLSQLRLMVVGDFADLFVKPVRNLAKEYNKSVRLHVMGGDVEADITLLEQLREPIIHLFRNSIAHGIEPPDEREKIGKTAEGKITLGASRKRDSLLIKISDDGRGIGRSAITDYLKKKQSFTDEQISQLPDKTFFNTILSPDFSSATETTDMAGRGIGMNVVAQAVNYLGGTMTISSESSKGAEFTITLPVTLSIIYTVTFTAGPYTLSVPTTNVKSIRRSEDIPTEERDSFSDLRQLFGVQPGGRQLQHVIDIQEPEEKDNHDQKEKVLRLRVDAIIGIKPLMVMPAGELLGKVKIFSGIGVMENGDISILLDTKEMKLETGNYRGPSKQPR